MQDLEKEVQRFRDELDELGHSFLDGACRSLVDRLDLIRGHDNRNPFALWELAAPLLGPKVVECEVLDVARQTIRFGKREITFGCPRLWLGREPFGRPRPLLVNASDCYDKLAISDGMPDGLLEVVRQKLKPLLYRIFDNALEQDASQREELGDQIQKWKVESQRAGEKNAARKEKAEANLRELAQRDELRKVLNAARTEAGGAVSNRAAADAAAQGGNSVGEGELGDERQEVTVPTLRLVRIGRAPQLGLVGQGVAQAAAAAGSSESGDYETTWAPGNGFVLSEEAKKSTRWIQGYGGFITTIKFDTLKEAKALERSKAYLTANRTEWQAALKGGEPPQLAELPADHEGNAETKLAHSSGACRDFENRINELVHASAPPLKEILNKVPHDRLLVPRALAPSPSVNG